ncbi:S-adenosyl-L-methionine-dependent methyltransferase [Calocera cornea HHB12733]|uniref:S-adenosyl-L-methionine-dependent methyltransferase n=1 Tax=Calocera cornea HHB12733 TaxID=1353952 RepID=A0A165GBE5_9BASI|nr:S-adenosyl-L-methionine-dependent methyltransferase [Calocera cornea HHB12733]
MEETELETLVSALNKAASVLQDTLRQERLPPFDSTDPSPHPWDDGLPSPTGWYARKAILGLCHRIISLVQNPIERSVADQFSLSLLSSMNAVAQARPTVAEIVLKSGSSGVELAEVAFRSGINATKLSSIMHVLTSWDYFKETSAGRYAPTRSSRALLPDAPVANLSGTTNAGMEAASTLALTAKMPSDSGHPTPFDVYHKVNFYGWLQENPELSDEFNRGMKDWERIADPGLVVDLPVEDLGTHITLVDVGSGFGALAMQFLKQYPGWQAVLQDQPAVISEAESFWKREASEIVEAGRVSFLGHSFFEPTVLPPAREGSPYVFMIKSVLHNWPDDLAANILEVRVKPTVFVLC